MTTVIAHIELFDYSRGRKTPLFSGYRPDFQFTLGGKCGSGEFTILDKDKECIIPGEKTMIQIRFLSKKVIGDDFGLNFKFFFGEGRHFLGVGEILEILEE